jgi:hypothetical protein
LLHYFSSPFSLFHRCHLRFSMCIPFSLSLHTSISVIFSLIFVFILLPFLMFLSYLVSFYSLPSTDLATVRLHRKSIGKM